MSGPGLIDHAAEPELDMTDEEMDTELTTGSSEQRFSKKLMQIFALVIVLGIPMTLTVVHGHSAVKTQGFALRHSSTTHSSPSEMIGLSSETTSSSNETTRIRKMRVRTHAPKENISLSDESDSSNRASVSWSSRSCADYGSERIEKAKLVSVHQQNLWGGEHSWVLLKTSQNVFRVEMWPRSPDVVAAGGTSKIHIFCTVLHVNHPEADPNPGSRWARVYGHKMHEVMETSVTYARHHPDYQFWWTNNCQTYAARVMKDLGVEAAYTQQHWVRSMVPAGLVMACLSACCGDYAQAMYILTYAAFMGMCTVIGLQGVAFLIMGTVFASCIYLATSLRLKGYQPLSEEQVIAGCTSLLFVVIAGFWCLLKVIWPAEGFSAFSHWFPAAHVSFSMFLVHGIFTGICYPCFLRLYQEL
eukprot:TRINITY_DN68116_c0_g1_i1.p1 TRINITY_DN68116_c0_g1~~TRINITY_DN68116_c0_g1_i1.p1  ORF type:complete len:415 (-),score=39.60 TRINITY_DN68116_c0_g1_i1:52-1296(-)